MKPFVSFLLALSLLLTVSGCRRSVRDPDSGKTGPESPGISSPVPSGASAKSEGVLEHVWSGEEFPMPDGWSLAPRVTPYYEPRTGILTCCGVRHREYDDGEEHPYYEYAVVTFTGKSALVSPLEDPAPVECGVFTEEEFWYLRRPAGNGSVRYDLVRRNLSDGREESADCRDLFREEPHFNNTILTDGEGNVWIPSYGEVICVSHDMKPLVSVVLGNAIPDTCALRQDGTLFISEGTPDGYVLTGIDRERGRTGEELPQTAHPDRIAFLDGYDYVYSSSGGIYGALVDGKTKEIVSECLVDYVNSGMNADAVSLLLAADGETLLFSERRDDAVLPLLCRPEGTVSLADITVLEIAYTYWLYEPAITQAVTDFNRKHADARIVLLDYSVYSKDYGDPSAANRLTMDMVTGICSPDIVLGHPGEDAQIEQILRKKLYRDLGGFLDSDQEVNRETVFGSVLSAFADREGRIWGMPRTFTASWLEANRAVLDACGMAGKEGWTLGEMLDFARGLPDGVTLCGGLTRDTAPYSILGNYGLGLFFDDAEGLCAFDSPDFFRYLEFVASLPKDGIELKKVSPFDAAAGEPEEYDFRYNGKVALDSGFASGCAGFCRLEGAFGTKEWDVIGYPTRDGGQGPLEVSSGRVMCITTFCEAPELAWEFVRSVILSKRGDDAFGPAELSILRERTEQGLTALSGMDLIQNFRGNSFSTKSPKSDPPLTPADLREPGYIIDFTANDRERILALLDGEAYPIAKKIPEAVSQIVNEEISGFLAGRGSASDCAGKIQSRVSLWLAEHQ